MTPRTARRLLAAVVPTTAALAGVVTIGAAGAAVADTTWWGEVWPAITLAGFLVAWLLGSVHPRRPR